MDEKTFMDDLMVAFDDRAKVILHRLDARDWDLLIGVIESLWSAYFSIDYKDVAAFSILAIVLIFLPSGILGRPEVEKVWSNNCDCARAWRCRRGWDRRRAGGAVRLPVLVRLAGGCRPRQRGARSGA